MVVWWDFVCAEEEKSCATSSPSPFFSCSYPMKANVVSCTSHIEPTIYEIGKGQENQKTSMDILISID
jgi:hypothetical protein